MNNFFLDGSDMFLFKRAMRETKNEPVVINILSSDPSLKKDVSKTKTEVVRKTFSDKFEPSPFGKFFGPRKTRTAPVDMSDFSSWKNKNYRDAEKSIGTSTETDENFSVSDYMAKNAASERYHELDQAKSELQKPINQLSSSDPQFKKYSLDSFMTKLEEQTKVKDKFEENDDILEPLGDLTAKITPDSSQDENFGFSSDFDIEKLAQEDTKGDKFRFDSSELDKIKTRLEKIEKENQNIKDKPNEKVISTEIKDLTKGDDDELDVDNLTKTDISGDDIDAVNKKLKVNDVSEIEKNENAPKINHKKFVEINKNGTKKDDSVEEYEEKPYYDLTDEDETSKDDSVDDEESDDEILKSVGVASTDENEDSDDELNLEKLGVTEDDSPDVGEESMDESDENVDNLSGSENESEKSSTLFKDDANIKRSDILTKEDFKNITDELLTKLSSMQRKDDSQNYDGSDTYGYGEPYDASGVVAGGNPNSPVYDMNTYAQKQNELQEKILELIERNKKEDTETEEKLKQAELEKERVAKEYEEKLKQLEENYKKDYEAFKHKAYLEKLDSDIRLQKAESDFKAREQKIKEKEKALSKTQKAGEMLRKELKSNVSISNLEMEKKLLEKSNREVNEPDFDKTEELHEEVQEKAPRTRKPRTTKTAIKKAEPKETKKTETKTEEKKKTPSKTAASKKTSPAKRKVSRPKSNTRRRKIDSDIIGGIDFE